MTENIVTNKKYRILVDEVNDVWDRISFWSRASDVHFDDGTTAEMNRPINVLQRNKAYAVGTVVYEPTAPSWVLLRCTVAGTTAPVTPTTYQTITNPGVVITDGSAGAAKFTVYDVRPNSSMSESAYQIPTTNLVNNLNSQLTTDDGDKFQFAYDREKDKYGFVVDGIFTPFGYADKTDYTDQTVTSGQMSESSGSQTQTLRFDELTRIDAIMNYNPGAGDSWMPSSYSLSISGNTITITQRGEGAGGNTGNHRATITARQYHAFDD